MKPLLYDGIDEPGLNTLAVYRDKRGGYEMLKRALDMEPADVLSELHLPVADASMTALSSSPLSARS